MTNTAVVLTGYGPHVRFKTSGTTPRSVRVVTRTAVKTVRLGRTTDVKFHAA